MVYLLTAPQYYSFKVSNFLGSGHSLPSNFTRMPHRNLICRFIIYLYYLIR